MLPISSRDGTVPPPWILVPHFPADERQFTAARECLPHSNVLVKMRFGLVVRHRTSTESSTAGLGEERFSLQYPSEYCNTYVYCNNCNIIPVSKSYGALPR